MMSSEMSRKISTTALSKEAGVKTKEMFSRLMALGYIAKENGVWTLTAVGKEHGGISLSSKHGKYIAWPKDLTLPVTSPTSEKKAGFITATKIGKVYELSATRVNFVLSELGWVKKDLKGWIVTEQGEQQGGLQVEDYRSGIPYVRWPENIAESKVLRETINNITGNTAQKTTQVEDNFRDKFKATHRSTDGHMVRSKAEMLIDNWLYMAEIVHAYERKLPVEEEVYCDFYIPTGKVYIEYWGLENDKVYLARKQTKKNIYGKYGFNLIELNDKEVQNLDDILPRLLLKYGVQSY